MNTTTIGVAMVLGCFLVAVTLTALGVWLLCGETVRRQARTIRRLRRKVVALTHELSDTQQATTTGAHHHTPEETPHV